MTTDTPATGPAPAQPAPAPRSVPGYAAGPGLPGEALDAAHAAGWTRHADEAANVTYIGPDRRAQLSFGPETERYAASPHDLWQATYTADPDASTSGALDWEAFFGDDTPAEAIAAFITTLTRPTGGDRDGQAHVPIYATGPGQHAVVRAVCQDAGFTIGEDLADESLVSPDGALRVTYKEPSNQDDDAGWQAAYIPLEANRDWYARFSAAVPTTAIAAFLSVLTDPAGLDPDRA